jgi:hypothetical protein
MELAKQICFYPIKIPSNDVYQIKEYANSILLGLFLLILE